MSSDKKQDKKQAIDVSQKEIDELKRDMQSARLTAWAQAHQQKLIGGVLALLVLLVAVSFWKEHHDTQRASAAALYHQALSTQQQDDKRALLQSVVKGYENTGYAGLARMLLASVDAEHAAEHLQALLDQGDADRAIKAQARIDLAGIRLAAGDKAAVRQLLSQPGVAAYEQLRHYLLARAAETAAERRQHLQKARDAESYDAELSRRIEQEFSAAGGSAPTADPPAKS